MKEQRIRRGARVTRLRKNPVSVTFKVMSAGVTAENKSLASDNIFSTGKQTAYLFNYFN